MNLNQGHLIVKLPPVILPKLEGDGVIVQGDGSQVATGGSVIVGGNVDGNLILGSSNESTDDKPKPKGLAGKEGDGDGPDD